MAKPALQRVDDPEGLEGLFFAAARSAGWKVAAQPVAGSQRADALISRGSHRYIAEFKETSEGRRDRLVPALSQAILEARSLASAGSLRAKPLAVVGAPRIQAAVLRALRDFAQEHAPDVAIGVMDREGLRVFIGPGLESLNEESRPAGISTALVPEPAIDLFSDLNQWMLKVLLAPHIERADLMPAGLPRHDYPNASALAKVARVSVMSAFRFLRQLDREGFLHESRDHVRLVRLEALLQRWQATGLKPARELQARWILSAGQDQLPRAMKSLGPRSCVGLFAAARALGLGHVQGVPIHIYVDDLRADRLKQAGLRKAEPGDRVDVVLRVPPSRESVFRGTVNVEGLPVSDVLQVWLDVGTHPARGKEQADVVYRRVIKPMIEHANAEPR